MDRINHVFNKLHADLHTKNLHHIHALSQYSLITASDNKERRKRVQRSLMQAQTPENTTTAYCWTRKTLATCTTKPVRMGLATSQANIDQTSALSSSHAHCNQSYKMLPYLGYAYAFQHQPAEKNTTI